MLVDKAYRSIDKEVQTDKQTEQSIHFVVHK